MTRSFLTVTDCTAGEIGTLLRKFQTHGSTNATARTCHDGHATD